MERLTKKISKTIQDKYSLGSFLYYDFAKADDTNKLLNKLGQFEDFMEEQGFESLEELKKALCRQFEIREAPFRYGQEINGVFFSNEQIMVLNQFTEFSESWLAKYKNSEAENQALKDRWEKLKEYVADNLEITQVCQDPIEQEEYWCLIGAENCYKNLQEKIQELEE